MSFARRRGRRMGRVFLPYTEDDSHAKLSHSSTTQATIGTTASTSSTSPEDNPYASAEDVFESGARNMGAKANATTTEVKTHYHSSPKSPNKFPIVQSSENSRASNGPKPSRGHSQNETKPSSKALHRTTPAHETLSQSTSSVETRSSCPEVDTFVSSLTGLSSNRDIGMMSKDEIIGLLYNEAIRFKERSEELESQLDQAVQERDQAHVRMMLANEKLSRLKTDHKLRQKRLTDEQQMMQQSLDEAVAINQELHKSLGDQMNEKQVLLFRLDAQEGTITFLRRKIAELSALLNNRASVGGTAGTAASVSATEKSAKAESLAVSAATSVHSPPQRSANQASSNSSAAMTDASGFASDMRVKMEQRRSKRNGLISRMNSVGSGFSGGSRSHHSRNSSRSSRSSGSSSYKSTGLTDEDIANTTSNTHHTPNVNSVAADDGSSQTESMRKQFSRHSSIQNALSFFANDENDGGGRGMNLDGVKTNRSLSSDDVVSVISILSDMKSADSISSRGPVSIPTNQQKFNPKGSRAA